MSDDINFLQFLIQWLIEFFQTPEGITLVSVLTIVSTIIAIWTMRDFSQKHKKDSEKQPAISENQKIIPISNFTAQLGNPKNPGFLDQAERLKQIQPGQNPYLFGPSLLGNSPVFYGRTREFFGTLDMLYRQDRSGSVNIVGERRIGKSSLLNQIHQDLAKKTQFVSIYATTQSWNFEHKEDFFKALHHSICEVLPINFQPISGYETFCQFIGEHSKTYRFIFLIDEFDRVIQNPIFDVDFFSNMRVLGNEAQYNFSYVIASRNPLEKIVHRSLNESSFHNIFNIRNLGLLEPQEAQKLIQEPTQQSIGSPLEEIQVLPQKIFFYSGYHPAFIQLVMGKFWEALRYHFEIDKDAIESELKQHYQDLWHHRTEREQQLLLQIVKHEPMLNNADLETLRQRGLLTKENQIFAKFFEQMIIELHRLGPFRREVP